jgi:hypothetical protein
MYRMLPEAPAMPPAPRWQLLLPSRRFQAQGLLNKQVAAGVGACAVSCDFAVSACAIATL